MEKDLENEIVMYCKCMGGLALKLKLDGQRGWPDRTLLFPGAKIGFIEAKTEIGTLKYQQVEWIRKLTELGFDVAVIRTPQDAKKFIDYVRAAP